MTAEHEKERLDPADGHSISERGRAGAPSPEGGAWCMRGNQGRQSRSGVKGCGQSVEEHGPDRRGLLCFNPKSKGPELCDLRNKHFIP